MIGRLATYHAEFDVHGGYAQWDGARVRIVNQADNGRYGIVREEHAARGIYGIGIWVLGQSLALEDDARMTEGRA